MEPADEINQVLTIAPATWPGPALEVQPGDLTRFVPAGLGMAIPAIMRPWDRVEDVVNRPNYYGFNEPSSHPFFNAPVNDSAGGVIYFNGWVGFEQLEATLALLEVRGDTAEYAAFWGASSTPLNDRYLEQLRLISPYALANLFGVKAQDDTQPLVTQKLTVSQALRRFIELQREKYGSSSLNGVMGGDGDWAKESLAFGFMVENSYHGIYRIWSRAWLVTK
jgi:hypothetical protein